MTDGLVFAPEILAALTTRTGLDGTGVRAVGFVGTMIVIDLVSLIYIVEKRLQTIVFLREGGT